MDYHSGRRPDNGLGIVDYRLPDSKVGEARMKEGIFFSEPFILALNLGAYMAGVWLYRRFKFPLIHPLLTAALLVICYLTITGTPYLLFFENSRILRFLLDISVVSFGYLLWEQSAHIKKSGAAIMGACFIGSLTGIITVVLMAWLMGADSSIISSLQPKSVTTPIAIGISEQFGGIPALTAVLVILCGIFGSVVGPFILDKCGIKSSLARGLALGAAAHGLGTARAMKIGALEGAAGGIAIGVMGIFTALCAAGLAPLWRWMGIL